MPTLRAPSIANAAAFSAIKTDSFGTRRKRLPQLRDDCHTWRLPHIELLHFPSVRVFKTRTKSVADGSAPSIA